MKMYVLLLILFSVALPSNVRGSDSYFDDKPQKYMPLAPMGSRINQESFEELLSSHFSDLSFRVIDLNCPNGSENRLQNFSSSMDSINCKKEEVQDGVFLYINSTFKTKRGAPLVQHHVAGTKYRYFEFMRKRLESLDFSIFIEGSRAKCLSVNFQKNYVNYMEISGEYTGGLKAIKSSGRKPKNQELALSKKTKKSMIEILKKLCTSYEDKRACEIVEEVKKVNCGSDS